LQQNLGRSSASRWNIGEEFEDPENSIGIGLEVEPF
jgi:hypothetical protein